MIALLGGEKIVKEEDAGVFIENFHSGTGEWTGLVVFVPACGGLVLNSSIMELEGDSVQKEKMSGGGGGGFEKIEGKVEPLLQRVDMN